VRADCSTEMILLAGVGYSHMRDLSFGPTLVDRLRQIDWPDYVQVEDLSYGPIAIVQWLEDDPGRFDRAIIAGAMPRDREPGTLSIYQYATGRLTPDLVQERVAEAVTGVVSLENVLIIAEHFGVLPHDTVVIELEPAELDWGLDLTRAGQDAVEQAVAWIRQELRPPGERPVPNGRKHPAHA
jgi:hydrogenase maturation protease